MNRWAAIALGTVSLIAAVALFLSGNMIPAAVALAFSVACDVVFVVASRSAATARKEP
ncbi:MAG: hypothetical protein IT517_08670 [Burkholderiales bacterium]|nr:hypothetical protein [Burkholderiales bacterium]